MPTEILVKNKALEAFVEEIASAYAEGFPEFYNEFLAVILEEKTSLVKSTGMSDRGHFLTWCKIPLSIYQFVKQQARKRLGIPDFFAHESNYRLLCRVWSDLKIKTKPSAFYQVPKEISGDQADCT